MNDNIIAAVALAIFLMLYVFLLIFVVIHAKIERECVSARASDGLVARIYTKKSLIGSIVRYYIEVDCEVFAHGAFRTVRRTYSVPMKFCDSLRVGSLVYFEGNEPLFCFEGEE